jgi:purine-binding chemotaxis protein CheW
MLSFHLGDEPMGMAAQAVREIVAPPRLTRVPHAPEALLGMAGLRGDIVPVLSLARLLKRQDTPMGRVIVADFDGPVGLAVTSVSQMMDHHDAEKTTLLDIAALIAQAMPERRARPSRGTTIGRLAHQREQVETLALIAFSTAGQEFALPLAAVLDVMSLPGHITRMPLADRVTVGGISWRGRVLPLLGLAALLGLKSAASAGARVMVVRIGGHHLGLVVDAMRSVERVREEDIDPVPPCSIEGRKRVFRPFADLRAGHGS